jgi:signal transduction histidine kinase
VSAELRPNAPLPANDEAARQREARQAQAARAAADVIYERDLVRGQMRWEASRRAGLAYPAEEPLSHWRERLHPDERERVVASLDAAQASGEAAWQAAYRCRRLDGSYTHVLDRGQFIYDAPGKPVRMVGLLIDLSDRVEAAGVDAQRVAQARLAAARQLHAALAGEIDSLELLAEAGNRLRREGDLEGLAHALNQLGATAAQAATALHRLAYLLRPLGSSPLGLAGNLEQRLQAVERRAGLNATLAVEGALDLPAPIEAGLFEIAEEVLNNVLRHAQARAVAVRLSSAPGEVCLEISDDGEGFDLRAAADSGGQGLARMRARAEALHGSLVVAASPGAGARVLVRVTPPGA